MTNSIDLPPVPELIWLSRNQNPFNLRCLDCRSFTKTMVSSTSDKKIANQFLELRKSVGLQHMGKRPEGGVRVDCNLRYPFTGGTKDGPLITAKTMEDKWDLYLYKGFLYIARSWTGSLVFKVEMDFREPTVTVNYFEASPGAIQDGEWLAISEVDYLIKSHIFRREAPHTLPPSVPDDVFGIAAYSFQAYGRWASFATFEDATQVPLKDCPSRPAFPPRPAVEK